MSFYDVDRDGGNYTHTFNWVGPNGFLSSAQFGDVNVDIVDAETGTVIASDIVATYITSLNGGRVVRPVTEILGLRAIAFRHKPQVGPNPDFRYDYTVQRTVTDILKRQDEIELNDDVTRALLENGIFGLSHLNDHLHTLIDLEGAGDGTENYSDIVRDNVSGLPIAGALVYAVPTGTTNSIASTISAADGTFTLSGLHVGHSYDICANKNGYWQRCVSIVA